METWERKTLQNFAKTSDFMILIFTTFIAMSGAVLSVVANGPGIWGPWILLCFITIIPIHRVCKAVVRLQDKIIELEKQIKNISE